ncbi:hypothetical protein, partial [Holospora undulata]|uniref:hypothetical protein n=1 Tax=Holospora undulata TaxID=1169117 RepID=UPI000558E607
LTTADLDMQNLAATFSNDKPCFCFIFNYIIITPPSSIVIFFLSSFSYMRRFVEKEGEREKERCY